MEVIVRHRFFDIAFTPSVQAEQSRRGSRAGYANVAGKAADQPALVDRLTQREIDFIGARDSFYLASVSETGWPYVQHRGGPPGFVRYVDNVTIGWAEFVGNRQYISVGNTVKDDRVAMIFMDYPEQMRLKLLGHLRTQDAADRPDLAQLLVVGEYQARIERLMTVTVEAFDWNCPQHITPRFTLAEIERVTTQRGTRIPASEGRFSRGNRIGESAS
jgi:predicted pyridoxine 5'-phosphate oxidase superfamily flavin-nucleotide-binding protein